MIGFGDLKQILQQFVDREWLVIKGAPAATIGIALLSVFLSWGAHEWHYGGQIDGKDITIQTMKERISLRDDQIADQKEKLWDSPDEAKSKLVNAEYQKFLAYRTLADIAGRYVIDRTSRALQGDWAEYDAADFEVCFDSLNNIPDAEIRPPDLIYYFKDIRTMLSRTQGYIQQRSATEEELQETFRRAQTAMKVIDDHLASLRPLEDRTFENH